MAGLWQTIANGILISGTYALTAVGLTLVFGFMGLVNFAHGELYMLGAYMMYTFVVLMSLPFSISLVLAILSVAALAYLLDYLLFRPLLNQDMLIRMLTTIGIMVLFENLAQLIWNPVPKKVSIPLESSTITIGSVHLPMLHLIIICVAAVLILGFHLFMKYTETGMAMRATFQDRDVANAYGVDVKRVYGFTFAIGAAMAAAGGALLSTVYLITPTMGDAVTNKAFAVVILGGLGNFMGAIVGAFVVGITETFGATYLIGGYKDAIAFVLLVLILVIKPTGIMGKGKGVEQ
jgi:branched-chain amino acid transport system permease protein